MVFNSHNSQFSKVMSVSPSVRFLLFIAAIGLLSRATVGSSSLKKRNILFISIDDLRPELGVYGFKHIYSPNIDKLATQSVVFDRAYSQISCCSPSRASLLTGRRPDSNRVWKIEPWRDNTNATTIPQYFKENGYISLGAGKIFHYGTASGYDDYQHSWSPEGLPYFQAPLLGKGYNVQNMTSSYWAFEGYADNQLPDGEIADKAVEYLRKIMKKRRHGDKRPFFLAVGFHKPHLPMFAPAKYFDLYPPIDEIELPLNPNAPPGIPPIAWVVAPYLFQLHDIRKYYHDYLRDCIYKPENSIHGNYCRIPERKTRELRRAYYACISYTDRLVGQVLRALNKYGFANDTAVVLWSDHGWLLGEHNQWSKFSNFETGLRVPLIVKVPGMTEGKGHSDALVELIDLFPSLTELAGLEVPMQCPEGEHNILACHEGNSFVPLLTDPDKEWKKAAFSQYPRPSQGLQKIPGLIPKPLSLDQDVQEHVMGYTIRVDNYRFTEWVCFNRTTAKPNWSEVWGTELYDHTEKSTFFNDENENLAYKPEMKTTIDELRQLLHAGWRDAVPTSDQ